jgi:hypothetical protein
MQTNSYAGWMTRPFSMSMHALSGLSPDGVPPMFRKQTKEKAPQRPVASWRDSVNEDRLRILKMLEEGKIKADEAARLMEALDRTSARPTESDLRRKWLHIKVEKEGRETVNVRVPLALLKFGFKFGSHAMKHEAERARHQAERAHRHAEKIRERIDRRLKSKFGKDFDSNVGEVIDKALEEVEESLNDKAGSAEFLGRELDLEKILKMAQEDGFDGKIIDVYDEDDDEHVVVRLE